MNTNAATVATLSSKLVDAVTTRRSKPQRRVNAVTTRRLSNQMPQKSLSQSVARRSQSKSK